MKPKEKPDSKISSPEARPNKKKTFEARDGGKKMDTSLLRKNEFVLIIIGALLLTIIIFFLFFRASSPVAGPEKKNMKNSALVQIEKRIEIIEKALQLKGDNGLEIDHKTPGKTSDIGLVRDRVTRLETAFSIKFNSLIERMGKIEKNISNLQKKSIPATSSKPGPKVIIPVKKAKKKEKKTSMFHTVKKGETLYSISKKYKTSIAALQKLNHLTSRSKIYPGNNILIR